MSSFCVVAPIIFALACVVESSGASMTLEQYAKGSDVPEVVVALATEIERQGDALYIYLAAFTELQEQTHRGDELLADLLQNPEKDLRGYEMPVLCMAMLRFFTVELSDELIPWEPVMREMVEGYEPMNLHVGSPASSELMLKIHNLPLVRRHTVAFMLLHLKTILRRQMDVSKDMRIKPISLGRVTVGLWSTKAPEDDILNIEILMTALISEWSPEFICTAKTTYSSVLVDKCDGGSIFLPIKPGVTIDYEQQLYKFEKEKRHSKK